jgi:hypothetical protein
MVVHLVTSSRGEVGAFSVCFVWVFLSGATAAVDVNERWQGDDSTG